MKFKKLRMKNIRSYEDQEIEFPSGSLLFSGDIGSGKTSILLALEYALFGLQPGQKGSALLRNNESLGEVSLEIDLPGKNVLIERRLRRTSKGVSNEQSSITINGRRLESSLTEVKSKIVEILGYPQEFVKKGNLLYKYTIFTPQEQMKQIILEDSETRLNILRHTFGIDKYRIIKSNLSILLMNLKSESKFIQGEIKNLEEDKENLFKKKSQIKSIEEEARVQSLEIQEKIKEINLIESELKEIERKIEEKKNFSNELEKAKIFIAGKRESLNEVKREKEEITSSIKNSPEFKDSDYHKVLDELKITKSALEILNFSLINLNGKIVMLEQETKEILLRKERIFKIDICSTCLQDVSVNHKHNILNETEAKISAIRKELNQLNLDKKDLPSNIEEKNKLLSSLEEKKINIEVLRSRQDFLEKSKVKLLLLQKQESNIERDIEILIKHTDSLKENILRYSPFEIHYKTKDEELKKSLNDEKKKEIHVAELKKELELNGREVFLLEEAISRKEKSKSQLYKLNELTEWLSNDFLRLLDFTERNVLLKVRSEFSSLLRKWFLMLIPENSLDIRIDENFSPIILQKETEMDYDYLSGGERTAVALAYRLALNQIINSLLSKIKTKGIIILDEPTEGFSEDQVNKIRDIIGDLNIEQLIIVSHEQKIESFVSHVFKIIKEGDVSFIKSNI